MLHAPTPSDMPMALDCTVERDGPVATMVVTGEIDAANAADLADAVERVIDAGVERLALDLHGVGFIDSAGLRVIAAAAHRLDTPGGRGALRVVRPTESLRRLFDATGLTHRLRVDHASGP